VNTLETVCATLGFLAGAGELAVARKWVRFSITIGTPAPPKNSAKKTDAIVKPGVTPAAKPPLEVAA
jgi:hypothetical protein